MYKKVLILMLATANLSLFAMQQPPLADLRDYPLAKVDSALRIQTREALRRNDLETASSLMERLLARNMNPGTEVMVEIQNRDLAIRLALVAAGHNDDKAVAFLMENFIKAEKLKKTFEEVAGNYFCQKYDISLKSEIIKAVAQMRSYLILARKINNPDIINPNAHWGNRRGNKTLLTHASALLDKDTVILLLQLKAHANLQSDHSEGALSNAAFEFWRNSHDAKEIIYLLLKADANPNLVTIEKSSPLILLTLSINDLLGKKAQEKLEIISDAQKAIELLLEHNADPCIMNMRGQRVIDHLPLKPEYENIRKLLQNAMNKAGCGQKQNCPEPMDTSD